jgi:23S rRNA pseudouridine1911/1915/1917 synthase
VASRLDDEGEEALGLLAFDVSSGPVRLDAFLFERLKDRGHSRSELQGWIAAGRVGVTREVRHPGQEAPRVLKASFKLRAGDSVDLDLPPPPGPPEPIRAEDLGVPVLHQDEAILVLDKPAGLTVHPGAGQRQGTLVSALLHLSPEALSSYGGAERPGIVHRLDKETSGVIVVARSDLAHRRLAQQFHDRVVKKRYLALTAGVPRPPEGLVDRPLGRHPKDRKKQAVVEGGRAARTRYVVREAFAGHALVECAPETGRTHQIRVHLKSLGTPIVADGTYGRAGPYPSAAAPVLTRHALHAWRLAFDHPLSGERVEFEAPLHPDMEAVLQAWREAA